MTVCTCPRFKDTRGFRIADLCCPIHGVDGPEPGDGPWFPPPKIGDRVAYKCRGHWHYGYVVEGYEDWYGEGDEPTIMEVMSSAVSLERAAEWVLGKSQ